MNPGDSLNAFTRATTARYHNEAGVSPLSLASAASGTPRFKHFIGTRRTLLVEGQRTNTILRSADPSNGSWTKTNVTVDAGAAVTAPDGASVSRITETVTNATHEFSQVITITDGETVAYGAYFRAGQRFRCLLGVIDGGSGGSMNMTLRTDTLATTAGAGGGYTVTRSYLDTTFGALGWYRMVLVGTAPAGVTSVTVIYRLLNDSGSDTYAGDTSKGAYWWGMQAERAAHFASSYIPTDGATVQRNGEIASVVMPFNPQEMWVYIRFIDLGTILGPDGTFGRVIDIGASFPDRTLIINRADADFYDAGWIQNASLSSNSSVSTPPVLGDLVEHLLVLDSLGRIQLHQSVNGGAVLSGALGVAIGFTAAWGGGGNLYIGSANGSNPAFNAYERLLIGRGSLGSGAARIMAKARGLAG